MKKFIIVFSIILLTINNLFADSGKARFHVIIDTDCAPDDLRAISLMLASSDFEILAITTSDGILKPKEGYIKIKSLLKEFGHEGIPVAYGEDINSEKSIHHSTCINIAWGKDQNIILPQNSLASDLIINEINNEKEMVILLCLGPLTNIIDIISIAEIKPQLDKVLWYCDDIENRKGANFEIDTLSAKSFIESDIEKYIVSNNNLKNMVFDNNILTDIGKIKNVYTQNILISHSHTEFMNKINSGDIKIWDDLLPLYLLCPELFITNTLRNNTYKISPNSNSTEQIKNNILKFLKLDYSKENQVFNNFPIHPELYADDLKDKVVNIIEKFGISEWRAGVLTNELHGHLGIYAILGVKMGLRVRQYYNIGVDDIKITSFAGSKPPISCFNDGLQVSTGGTLGHGLITISDEDIKRPEAIFQFKTKKVKLRLKNKYWKIIRTNVKEGITKYGNLTPEYWQHIRILAINYWSKWDRTEIFDIITEF